MFGNEQKSPKKIKNHEPQVMPSAWEIGRRASWSLSKGKVRVMKANQKKRLTFGDLIASVYTACSQRRARAIVRFAVNAHVVVFRGERRFVIS